MSKKDKYIRLLLEVQDSGMESLVHYLENKTDFFTAPASTRFHGSYEGGLLEHSLNVYERLHDNVGVSSVHLNVPRRTIILTSLLHDICKANFYSESTRNAKNEKTGKWEKVPYYTVDDELPYGHGEKSVFIISKYITLTTYESMMIRWHMGLSEPKEHYMYLGRAIEKFPLILALMNADMEATYILESEKH